LGRPNVAGAGVQQPVETICHNDVAPSNVVFRAGVPVALIDWEAASPGPRAADLGFAAWRWVPLWSEERCRAAGLPTSVHEKSRRLRLFLGAYGVKSDQAFVDATTRRLRQFLNHQTELVKAGSEWEVRRARRGVISAMSDEIDWVESHATELVDVDSGR
jgi:Phosphotransferase enzyme family